MAFLIFYNASCAITIQNYNQSEKTNQSKFFSGLNMIIMTFDDSLSDLLNELDHHITGSTEYSRIFINNRTPTPDCAETQYIEMKQSYQLFSFNIKYKTYFTNERSDYNQLLNRVIGSKNHLIELLGSSQDKLHFQESFNVLTLLIDSLTVKSPPDDMENPGRAMEIRQKFFLEKIKTIGLIIFFINNLFLFLTKHISRPLPLFLKNFDNKKIFDIDEQFSVSEKQYSKDNSILTKTINCYKAVKSLIDQIQKFSLPKYLENQFFSPHNTKLAIAASEKVQNKLVGFEACNGKKIKMYIKRAINLLETTKQAQSPAIWRLASWLIRLVPVVNSHNNDPAEEKKLEEATSKATKQFEKGKKDLESIISLTTELVKTTGRLHPAIAFLWQVQKNLFNNKVPKVVAEYTIKTFNFTKSNLAEIIKMLIEIEDGIFLNYEIEESKKAAATLSQKELFETYNKIFKERRKKQKKTCFNPQLQLRNFLQITKIPSVKRLQPVDQPPELERYYRMFERLYNYIKNNNTYIDRISLYLDFLPREKQENFHNSETFELLHRTLLYIAFLNDSATFHQLMIGSSGESPDPTQENNLKILKISFPGKKNLKQEIFKINKLLKILNNVYQTTQKDFQTALKITKDRFIDYIFTDFYSPVQIKAIHA